MDYAETITAERVRRVMRSYGEDSNESKVWAARSIFYENGRKVFRKTAIWTNQSARKIRRYVAFSENIPLDKQLSPDGRTSPYLLGFGRHGLLFITKKRWRSIWIFWRVPVFQTEIGDYLRR